MKTYVKIVYYEKVRNSKLSTQGGQQKVTILSISSVEGKNGKGA